MKKLLLIIFGIFGLIETMQGADDKWHRFNYTYEGNTVTYEILSVEDKTVTTCYGADMNPRKCEGHLIIPPKVMSDQGKEYIVTKIGQRTFDSNKDLISVSLPNTIIEIEPRAFSACDGLTGSLTIPNSVTSIGEEAFAYCDGLTGSLTIGDSVTSIGQRAFYYCSGLTGSLTIGDSVTSIGEEAFSCCSGLTGSLTIPNSVTSIGNYAFASCSGLTGSLTIGNSVTSIGNYAFYKCSGLTGSLTIPNSVTSIGKYAFSECSGLTGSLTIGNSVTSIDNYAFYKCSRLTGSLTIPNSVKSIGEGAFYYCYGLTGSLTIPNSVTSIGDRAFYCCNGLTGSLTIPNSVTSIGEAAFYECRFTGTLTIPESLTSISDLTFNRCNYITDVYLPATLTSIGANAFSELGWFNSSIKSIYCAASTPPVIGAAKEEAFHYELTRNATLIVPSESIELYKTAFNWEDFSNIKGDKEIEATSIELNKTSVSLKMNDSVQLYATILPETTTNKSVTWSSSDNDIAIVDSEGLVKAISVGTVIITATSANGLTAQCKITVKPVTACGITLNVEEISLLVGQIDRLTATILPENTTDKTVVWSSDNEAVVTISTDGTITAVSVGTAIITATCGEVSTTCKVTVNPVEASSIVLSLHDVTMLVGSTRTLTAKVFPENATYQKVLWQSSNPSIASIDNEGIITALQVGETTITASCGNISASCKVTVTPVLPSSIELNIKDMSLYIGQSEIIKAIVRPTNTTYPEIIWRSEDETIATVSENGNVTGIKEGVTTITAICGEVTAACIVTVKPIPATNIEIISGDVTLPVESSYTLIAKVSPDNTTHPRVQWSSSDPDIAIIADNGTITAVNIGTAIITAKCGTVATTCVVTVIPIPSDGILMSPSSAALKIGESLLLTATIYPENTSDKSLVWSSENPEIASVSSTGVVTAIGTGITTISARNGHSIAKCTITVSPIEATSISLNVKDETIFVASTTQLIANISPANVTDKTITWTSSKPEIATVSKEGVVVGVAVGTTTVTATCGDVSASCQINVVHRIPDIDPFVTTSNRDISTLSGRPVNMAVYPEGGEPAGWSYVWIKNGEVISRSSELNIIALNETENVITETYRVKVENEIDKVVILSEIFDFVVRTYPAIDDPTNDDGISVSNGTLNHVNKTREGNTITLSVATPVGGNPQGWEYTWKDVNGIIGESEIIDTIAFMSAGDTMDVEQSSYYLELTNYSPGGDIWGQSNFKSTINVYRRPQTPVQMLRKGDGSSHTFVAMMPITDAEFERLDYKLVYGWTDSNGENHKIAQTNLRYCHVDTEVYDNSTIKFWVYSVWNYQDGSIVSSGLRYLDGRVDESFDASVFDGIDERNDMNVKAISGVYTLDGHYMGTELNHLTPGIYIYINEKDGEMETEKIIIH